MGPWLLALPLAGAVKMQNKEDEEVLSDCSQRLLYSDALLLWVWGLPDCFPLQPQIQVGQGSLESFSLVLKPPSQTAVLGMDADTAASQVKHKSLEVTVPISLLQFHPDDLPQYLVGEWLSVELSTAGSAG